MVQRIAWIFDNGCVACRICVRAQTEEYFARIVHVAIFIHCHNVFTEHHLPHAPETVHDLKSLIRILFSNTDKDQIVKHAFGRQCHIHDFGKIHLEYRQENPHTSIADVIILHWRNAHNCCGVNRVAPVCDRR